MAENSHISWTNHTFNPWIGCTKISPACDGCYAAHLMGGGRYSRVEWGEPGKGVGTRSRTAPSNWAKVRKWNKLAVDDPGATYVFCASLADVFDNAVPAEWRRDLFDLIRATPNLTWLLLTKRPQMIVKLYQEAARPAGWRENEDPHCGDPEADARVRMPWPRNAAIGCTVVTQEEADRDVPKLLTAKAALNPAFAFLSMEPLLGPVDLGALNLLTDHPSSALSGKYAQPREGGQFETRHGPRIDWVITGGETDQGAHKARPADPAWFRSLRDQCAAAGVPFHFKQAGEWVDAHEIASEWNFTHAEGAVRYGRLANGDFGEEPQPLFGSRSFPTLYPWPETANNPCMVKVGKAHDPCTLDGVKHDARPT